MPNSEPASASLSEVVERASAEKSSYRAPLADGGLLLVSIVWGSSYVAMQAIGRYVSVPELLALRFGCAALILFLIFYRNIKNIVRQEIVIGMVFGSLLFSILALETLGVQYTSATNAGFLITLSVVIVPIFERLIGKVKHELSVYACAVVAFVGCGMLTFGGGRLLANYGDFVILAAAVVRGFQIFLFAYLTKERELSAVNITLVELTLVAVMAIIGSAIFGTAAWERADEIPLYIWTLTAYLGVLGTAYAFLVQLYVARMTSPTRVALILSTEPVFAALFGYMFANDTISFRQLIGCVMIFLAAVVGRTIEAKSDAR